MSHPNQLHGNHTWDLNLHYYRCPECGYIIEDRGKFASHFNGLYKELSCPRCHESFTIDKKAKPTFGPLLGHDPQLDD